MHAVTLRINRSLDTSTSAGHIIAARQVRCGPVTHDPEGGGINVARALTRQGSEATAILPAGGTQELKAKFCV